MPATHIFSQTGHILATRRRSLTSKSMEQLMCMKSWLKQGVAHLDGSIFEETVTMIDSLNVTAGLDDRRMCLMKSTMACSWQELQPLVVNWTINQSSWSM